MKALSKMNIQQWLKKQRIGVLYGGRSSEREISLKTGAAVLEAFKELGCNAVCVDADTDLPFQLKKKKITFAFIALHGPWGEDGTVQGMLEIMGIQYAGCGVLSSALAMNKIYSKRIFDAMNLPTPPWSVLECTDTVNISRLAKKLPVVVKPSTQGSAIGVSIVKQKKDLAPALKRAFGLDRQVLVEQYIAGTEITVGVLGDTVLPVIEIVPDNEFYDFESKYQPGKSQHLIPPRLPGRVIRATQDLARRVFSAMNCRAMARIDMIVDKNDKPWILEVNTIPGMTETSLFPDAARAAGLSFTEMIVAIVEFSLIP